MPGISGMSARASTLMKIRSASLLAWPPRACPHPLDHSRQGRQRGEAMSTQNVATLAKKETRDGRLSIWEAAFFHYYNWF
jgi:hypothetical protein